MHYRVYHWTLVAGLPDGPWAILWNAAGVGWSNEHLSENSAGAGSQRFYGHMAIPGLPYRIDRDGG